MQKYHLFKFFVVSMLIGFFSPSVTVEVLDSGQEEVSFTLLKKVEARRGGGRSGMRGDRGGMRRGGGSMRSRGGIAEVTMEALECEVVATIEAVQEHQVEAGIKVGIFLKVEKMFLVFHVQKMPIEWQDLRQDLRHVQVQDLQRVQQNVLQLNLQHDRLKDLLANQ